MSTVKADGYKRLGIVISIIWLCGAGYYWGALPLIERIEICSPMKDGGAGTIMFPVRAIKYDLSAQKRAVIREADKYQGYGCRVECFEGEPYIDDDEHITITGYTCSVRGVDTLVMPSDASRIFIPPLLLFAFGFIGVKVVRWVREGFDK